MVDVVGKFGSVVGKQKNYIHMLLLALILINWSSYRSFRYEFKL